MRALTFLVSGGAAICAIFSGVSLLTADDGVTVENSIAPIFSASVNSLTSTPFKAEDMDSFSAV